MEAVGALLERIEAIDDALDPAFRQLGATSARLADPVAPIRGAVDVVAAIPADEPVVGHREQAVARAFADGDVVEALAEILNRVNEPAARIDDVAGAVGDGQSRRHFAAGVRMVIPLELHQLRRAAEVAAVAHRDAFIEDVVGREDLEVAQSRAFVDAHDVERGRKLRTIRVVVFRERDEAWRDGGGGGGIDPADARGRGEGAGQPADGFRRNGGAGAFIKAEVGDQTVLATIELLAHPAFEVGGTQGGVPDLELIELTVEAQANRKPGGVLQAERACAADADAVNEHREVRRFAGERVVMPARVEGVRDDSRRTGVGAIADDKAVGAGLRHEVERAAVGGGVGDEGAGVVRGDLRPHADGEIANERAEAAQGNPVRCSAEVQRLQRTRFGGRNATEPGGECLRSGSEFFEHHVGAVHGEAETQRVVGLAVLRRQIHAVRIAGQPR